MTTEGIKVLQDGGYASSTNPNESLALTKKTVFSNSPRRKGLNDSPGDDFKSNSNVRNNLNNFSGARDPENLETEEQRKARLSQDLMKDPRYFHMSNEFAVGFDNE